MYNHAWSGVGQHIEVIVFYNVHSLLGQLSGWERRERFPDLRKRLTLRDVHRDDPHAAVLYQGMVSGHTPSIYTYA